jgi:phytanoyl-CoA hydroxylase
MESCDGMSTFEEQGYLVVPGFKSAKDVRELRARADAIVADFDPTETTSIFTTRDESTKDDDYFLGSADKIRCFFEEEAFDKEGRLRQSKALSINKIGHAMHDLDPVFEAFSHGTALADVARSAGLNDPRVYQSMYIFKQPHIGGEVRWHQDATYFWTKPITVTTFWFALENADRRNGCLWAQPGGHRTPLRERFVVENGDAHVRKLDHTPWPTQESAVPLEVEEGTLVIFHGLLPHYSAPNRSASSRHAYTLHAVDASAKYSTLNWLQRGANLPVRGFTEIRRS